MIRVIIPPSKQNLPILGNPKILHVEIPSTFPNSFYYLNLNDFTSLNSAFMISYNHDLQLIVISFIT